LRDFAVFGKWIVSIKLIVQILQHSVLLHCMKLKEKLKK
jgi:hypothetical protein